MARLRQVTRGEANEDIRVIYQRLFGDRDPVAQPGTATGTPGDWWTVFALVPDLLAHAQAGFGFFSSRRRLLPPYFRELAITRAGFLGGSQFVFSQHCKAARAAGVLEEKIADLSTWSSSPAYDDSDRAVLAYVDDLMLQDGRVQDATFARLKAVLGDEQILELTYGVCMYRLHATMTRALRLEYDDVDERIVEIAAPAGQGAADVMAQISR
jgi:alkylhydroperoxidase family enzyme